MDSFARDLRYVWRTLVRTPGFFLVTVATLGLGIGATTAIFSVVNGVLLRPLPYPDPDRVVLVWQVDKKGRDFNFSDPNYVDIRDESRSFAALAEFHDWGTVSAVVGTGDAVRARHAVASKEFFRVLGLQPVLGRSFVPEEQQLGGDPAVVISYGFWQRTLGAAPSALQTTIRFDGRSYRIVGVMPAAVDIPTGTELWTPSELEVMPTSRTAHNWNVVGRLRDGVSLGQAQRETSAIARALRQRFGDETWIYDAHVVPLREQLVGDVRPALVVLLAASGFLLLIGCANVVNLLVARMATRQGELALRLALGAGRSRLVRQHLTEALVLSLCGGVLGVLLGIAGVRALLALEPGRLPRINEVGVHWPVFLFALVVSVACAFALGLLTAWRATRGDIRETLAQSQRTQAGAGASHRIRSGLVVAQVALTLVLLVGAGLLARSFVRLLSVDPGFRADNAVVMDVDVPASDSSSRQRMIQFYDELMTRFAAIQGVREVGGANFFPLAGGGGGNGAFLVMSTPTEKLDFEQLPQLLKDKTRSGSAEFRVASPGFFKALHVPLVAGRLFDDRDSPTAMPAAVINASLAKKQWPNENPLGKIIQFGNMDGDLRPFTIVGVVGDMREESLADPPAPTFYAYYRQRPRRATSFYFVLDGAAPAASVIATARRMAHDLRPDVPPRFRTMDVVLADSLADRRFLLLLIGVFGGAALLLATLGVYSVISFLVAQRRQEIGVRVALGARSEDVLRLVLRQGATLALIGIVVGAAAALGLTRLITGLLYGVSATDPISFLGVMAILLVVALVASFIPARRAAKVDPMTVLRGS
ncbi:MAG TPA: ABC transporter permease [Gemmatimonadaceae bacterium]|nr:ABC transporter permease [Gemmatimonadaceae bacterium]